MRHLLAPLLLALPAPQGPFAELGYEAALAQAKEKQKLLFVDFTASWCPPCKRMEAEVWPHADVRAWLSEHAIAIQVDVDEEPELAQRFEVQAMPTVVVLRAGEEFDRVVGYKNVEELLAWAKDVAAGKRSSDALMERAKDLADSDEVEARYQLAKDLLRAKQYDLALQHYLWLWPATRADVGYTGVRVSFMLADMAALAKKHPPAKKAFLEIFEALQAKMDVPGVPTLEDWQEWKAMNGYFGHADRVLAWYERCRDESGRLFADKPSALTDRIAADVFDVLMQADRPQDAVRLFVDARKRAQDVVTRYERDRVNPLVEEAIQADMQAAARRGLTNDLTELYAALLAAGRGEEAGDVGALLIRTLDTPDSRLALVRAGIGVSRTEPNHERWLAEAEAAGANTKTVRRRLERLAEKSAAAPATGGGK